jgi:hypothetical protein
MMPPAASADRHGPRRDRLQTGIAKQAGWRTQEHADAAIEFRFELGEPQTGNEEDRLHCSQHPRQSVADGVGAGFVSRPGTRVPQPDTVDLPFRPCWRGGKQVARRQVPLYRRHIPDDERWIIGV